MAPAEQARTIRRPTALVTGGGSGIGAATARRLCAEGWQVAIAGRRPDVLHALANDIGALPVPADTADPGGAAAMVDAALERFGRLDALVCSAGTGAAGAVGEQTLERWNTVLATNLTGAFLVCRAALASLLETRGAIVTVASVAGLRAAPASAAYCSSKAGLVMLTCCLARDYGPQGLRANCVCPGWVRTERADGEMDALAARRGLDRAEAYALATAATALRRPGAAEEAAAAIAWLAGSDSSYVNGTVLTVDGGTAMVDPGTIVFGS